jgi:hypothetical protein
MAVSSDARRTEIRRRTGNRQGATINDMVTPLPTTARTNLKPPTADEVVILARGVASAARPTPGLTPLQQLLIGSVFHAMTGYAASNLETPIEPHEFAEALADRDLIFRTRILQVMILTALVLRPIPGEVTERIRRFAEELDADDGMLAVAERFASGSLALASFDFQRNGYTAHLTDADLGALHSATSTDDVWALATNDRELEDRWRSLESLPVGTIGRRITEFYRARGFGYPGGPGSAPPLLAQHDWVHVVADYGTTVESELEVFAFIARANDDPRAFSLLAMVVSLFETGYLRSGAGLFESDTGHLSQLGVSDRLADAMRRGALCNGSIDFLTTDWFELADLTVEEVREHFGVPEKSVGALNAGSVGPWERGGISPYQLGSGQSLATRLGQPYDSFGASI